MKLAPLRLGISATIIAISFESIFKPEAKMNNFKIF